MIPLDERIIFALDVADAAAAIRLVDRLQGRIRLFKIGMQLFYGTGWQVVDYIVNNGGKVMLDLKLYDIPATVQLAMEQLAGHGVSLTTVHAVGPVVEAALAADTGIKILAVTVLTSLGEEELRTFDFPGSVEELVLARADMALGCGCHGLVCSALEAKALRRRFGQGFSLVTPGIRPSGTSTDDQQRVATPAHAINSGVDHLVIGRPIRDAADPVAAVTAIEQEIRTALPNQEV
ncbi:MAG: orotidine-5'-phosphate decarboxylase [Desulfobulbus propionicus]|nr:MAG: orotidine-5'-phosphate decarboxylase [Desulfobulbus propionicus]